MGDPTARLCAIASMLGCAHTDLPAMTDHQASLMVVNLRRGLMDPREVQPRDTSKYAPKHRHGGRPPRKV